MNKDINMHDGSRPKLPYIRGTCKYCSQKYEIAVDDLKFVTENEKTKYYHECTFCSRVNFLSDLE